MSCNLVTEVSMQLHRTPLLYSVACWIISGTGCPRHASIFVSWDSSPNNSPTIFLKHAFYNSGRGVAMVSVKNMSTHLLIIQHLARTYRTHQGQSHPCHPPLSPHITWLIKTQLIWHSKDRRLWSHVFVSWAWLAYAGHISWSWLCPCNERR